MYITNQKWTRRYRKQISDSQWGEGEGMREGDWIKRYKILHIK